MWQARVRAAHVPVARREMLRGNACNAAVNGVCVFHAVARQNIIVCPVQHR